MPRADRAIRLASTLTVLLVAGVACWCSYWHAVEVITAAGGENRLSAHLLPATVDGLAGSASLVMLFAARYQLDVPRLVRVTLVVALGATMALNVLHGVDHGVLASVIAAWPAVALMLSWEMSVWIVDAARALDRRTVVTISGTEHGPREQLAAAVELLVGEPRLSAAEIGRRLSLPYQVALDVTKEARALIDAS